MKIFAVLLAFAGVISGVTAEVEKEGGVLILTDDNFDEEVAKHEFLLIEFYAPWCGHCKKLAPEYEKAAATLGEKEPPLFVAKVDTTKQEALGKRFSIQGFPTLKWFVNGKDQEYNGGRTADTIVSWITKKAGSPSDLIACDAVAAKTADKLAFVMFGAPEGEFFDAFMGAAKNADVEKFAFFHTGAECAEEHGVTAPGAAVFRNFDEPKVVYDGEVNSDKIVTFMKGQSTPTIFEFSEDYIEPIFQAKGNALFLFSEDKDAAYQAVFAEAAKEHKGKVLFSTSGVSSGIQERLGEFIGVTKDDMPCIHLVEPATDMKKFKFDGDVNELTAEALTKFINDFVEGKLVPNRKSEPVPESNDGPVAIVVGTEWEKIVGDVEKDVLMEYYAPWCGHCKALSPKWDELGEHVKDIKDLVIAKMDSTLNEVEGVEIRGYPTLKWYPKGNKKGEDYNDGREVPDFKDFLMKNSASYAAAFGEAAAAEEVKQEEL